MRVLVTGATGCVGRAVCAALAAGGHRVVAAARTPPAASTGVEPRALDLTDLRDVDDLVRDVGAVVHLGARAHTVPRTSVELEVMRATNVEATARLSAAAARAGIRRFVYASTVAVYGDEAAARGLVGDDAETKPSSPYGRGKLAAERTVRAAGGLALRLALVFGPGDRGNIATLLATAAAGRAFVIGDGRNQKSLVYSGNIADRVALALARDDAGWAALAGAARNVVDASPTQRALVDAVAAAVGRPPPRALPIAPFLLAGAAIDLGMRAIGRAPRWRSRVEKLAQATHFDGHALDEELGYTPRTSFGAGLEAQVRAGSGS